MLHPLLSTKEGSSSRDPKSALKEICSLASAIKLKIQYSEYLQVKRPRSATLFGLGVVERFRGIIDNLKEITPVNVIVIDTQLSPVQQRNLEAAWQSKVIDRTALILEIFGARAQTREGRLQVELAALNYQRSRLVRSWTHLERQRGGAGFVGGPGESQIELDRRMIDKRIYRIKNQIERVKRTRLLHRNARKRTPYPIIALVGYTNAGKSTLFNRLTKAEVRAKDQLFSTLDPTMRGITLPTGQQVIFSDTVGFVSNLPHELVKAFHATMEEVVAADLILHIRDVSHVDTEAQKIDVLHVLSDIGINNVDQRVMMIEVLNKIDLLDFENHQVIGKKTKRSNQPTVTVSALNGDGVKRLLNAIGDRLSTGFEMLDIKLQPTDGAALAWLYRNGNVISREDAEEAIYLSVHLPPSKLNQFKSKYRQ
ncbi:MAG: GTPase HflX [Magnetovibrio sp.]|nr:GTPase HflX [Magnetovibrio sp.]